MAAITLNAPVRAEFEALLVQIDDDLVRGYVGEAMSCLAVDAFRAATVMLWAGAIRTLQVRAMDEGPAAVNAALLKHHPKAPAVRRVDDFANVRDSLLLLACRELGMLDKGEWQILDHALRARNICGHPTEAAPGRVRTEAFIEDVVGTVWRR